MIEDLSKFGLPKGGILLPTFAYRYKVVPSFTSLEEHEALLFTQQVLNCTLDFKNRKIILNVRQSITPDVFNIVHKLVTAQRAFLDVDALDLACGMYNVWFEMDFGESRYISEKQQLQIFE